MVEKKMIDASVIISYIDSNATLPKVLRCLENQDYPRDRFEIILVNGDDYSPRASEPKGQMIGLEKSKGNVIFFTNSDRYPPSDWISYHMKHYPEWDLVAGNVIHHATKTLQAMNFGNISMKREVLQEIPLNDIPSQHDADFAFRFVKQKKFKGIVDGGDIFEPKDQGWNNAHYFLMARNIMVLRKRYRLMPPLSDFEFRLRHPAVLAGSISGIFANDIVNAHV